MSERLSVSCPEGPGNSGRQQSSVAPLQLPHERKLIYLQTLDISQSTPCGNNDTLHNMGALRTWCISHPNTPPFLPPPTWECYKWATATCPLLFQVAALRRTAIRGTVSERDGEMEEKKRPGVLISRLKKCVTNKSPSRQLTITSSVCSHHPNKKKQKQNRLWVSNNGRLSSPYRGYHSPAELASKLLFLSASSQNRLSARGSVCLPEL